MGPFDVGVLGTDVTGLLTGHTLLHGECTSLRVGARRRPSAAAAYSGDLS